MKTNKCIVEWNDPLTIVEVIPKSDITDAGYVQVRKRVLIDLLANYLGCDNDCRLSIQVSKSEILEIDNGVQFRIDW